MSVRDPGGHGFHAVAFQHLDRVDPTRVAHVSPDLTVLAGAVRLAPALRTHALLYEQRADVHAVVHLHSRHVAALSTTARPVGMYHVSSVLFLDEQVVHEDDGTRPHTAVVETLGPHRVAWMKNHGALLASQSLEQAVVEAITLEECAAIHLMAEAAGGTEIARAELDAGRRNFRPHHLTHTWEACLERTLDEWPELDDIMQMSGGSPFGDSAAGASPSSDSAS